MTLFEAIFMGIIQGATEFLPVSSSGHLAIFSIILGIETDTGMLFDILLHVGTLVAICVVYYKDVIGMIVEFIRMMGDIFYNIKAKSWNKKHKKQKEKQINLSSSKLRSVIVAETCSSFSKLRRFTIAVPFAVLPASGI